MGLLKIKERYLTFASLCTALVLLLYILTTETKTGILLLNSAAKPLSYLRGTNIDENGSELESYEGGLSTKAPSEQVQFPGLEEILEKAALPKKTLILTTFNAAWAVEDGMIDLFFGSFHAGVGISHYLDHLLIVALDQPSYDRCLQVHHRCFRLETEGVDFAAEKLFMSTDYVKMLWRRTEFMGILLEMGFSFLFTDADVMWFRDPFPHFSPEADFQVSCDHFNGNSTDIRNTANPGFVYVRSTERTILFYKEWYKARLDHPNQNEQTVLNSIKYTEKFSRYNLTVKFLETTYFGGFCEVSRNLSTVCTMHSNCCVGLDAKLFDLRLAVSAWAGYKAMTPVQKEEYESTKKVQVYWQAPRQCPSSFSRLHHSHH